MVEIQMQAFLIVCSAEDTFSHSQKCKNLIGALFLFTISDPVFWGF